MFGPSSFVQKIVQNCTEKKKNQCCAFHLYRIKTELFIIELINFPLASQAFTVEQLKKVPGEAIVDKAQQMHRLDASTLCSLNSNIKVESKQCLDKR